MTNPMQRQHMRDMIVIIVNSQHLRKLKPIYIFVFKQTLY